MDRDETVGPTAANAPIQRWQVDAILRERDEALDKLEWAKQMADYHAKARVETERERDEARAQRDALAEALRKIRGRVALADPMTAEDDIAYGSAVLGKGIREVIDDALAAVKGDE